VSVSRPSFIGTGENAQRALPYIGDAWLPDGSANDYRVLAAWPDFMEIALDDVLRPVPLTRNMSGI
jgi:hypothetical protein